MAYPARGAPPVPERAPPCRAPETPPTRSGHPARHPLESSRADSAHALGDRGRASEVSGSRARGGGVLQILRGGAANGGSGSRPSHTSSGGRTSALGSACGLLGPARVAGTERVGTLPLLAVDAPRLHDRWHNDADCRRSIRSTRGANHPDQPHALGAKRPGQHEWGRIPQSSGVNPDENPPDVLSFFVDHRRLRALLNTQSPSLPVSKPTSPNMEVSQQGASR
jgi:hypothetical protein